MKEKLKTLKDIIKATSDYGYPEAYNLSEEECKKHNLLSNGSGWNGSYSGERVRKDLQDAAREWVKAIKNSVLKYPPKNEPNYSVHSDCCCGNSCDGDFECIDWIKKFFNLEDDEDGK